MKKPTWPEIEALAEKHDDLIYSVLELQRFTRNCAFPSDLIALFWPKASARRQAFLRGETRYHGSLCHRHDTTERYVSDCKCVDCCLAINRDAYHRDPDADKRRSAAWHRANREYRNVYQQANYQKKREALA